MLFGRCVDALAALKVLVKIFMPGEYFEANATVAYANPALGLGLVFRDVKPHFSDGAAKVAADGDAVEPADDAAGSGAGRIDRRRGQQPAGRIDEPRGERSDWREVVWFGLSRWRRKILGFLGLLVARVTSIWRIRIWPATTAKIGIRILQYLE